MKCLKKNCLSSSKHEKLNKVFCLIGFLILIFFVVLSFLFTTYLENTVNQIFKATYHAFHRLFIVIGLSLIVFPIKLGYFTYFSNILKLKVLRITGKLSYSLYLTHIILIVLNVQGDDDVLIYSTEYITKLVTKIYSLGLIVSVFIYVVVESPFLKLERKLISR